MTLRYVLLEHEGTATYKPGRHFDLLLQWGESLESWELPTLPEPGERLAATSLAAHRTAYLEFEGELTAGRGIVRRVDRGSYERLIDQPDRRAYRLQGELLSGTLLLASVQGNWRAVYFAAAGGEAFSVEEAFAALVSPSAEG